MSDWPPKPQNEPIIPKQNGPEWQILEKAVLASVEEQRRSRRWGIFFKTLTFIYLLFIIVLMGKGCSTSKEGSAVSSSSAHLAVVDIIGTIDASSNQAVNSEDTNKALKRAFEASNSKAVALNINSPGGSPVQSDEIWQEIRYLKNSTLIRKFMPLLVIWGIGCVLYRFCCG